MRRETVSQEELLAIINAELAQSEDCGEARVTGPIYQLRDEQPDGCNWSDQITVSLRGNDPDECKRVLTPIMRRVRQRYNLAED